MMVLVFSEACNSFIQIVKVVAKGLSLYIQYLYLPPLIKLVKSVVTVCFWRLGIHDDSFDGIVSSNVSSSIVIFIKIWT